MKPNSYAVYAPPGAGLPFLSVMIDGHGDVEAREFETYDGAFRHGRHLQSAVERKERAAADRAYLVAHGLLNVLAA